MWCVAELDQEYIEKMEDVLTVYEKPYNPAELWASPSLIGAGAPRVVDLSPAARGRSSKRPLADARGSVESTRY